MIESDSESNWRSEREEKLNKIIAKYIEEQENGKTPDQKKLIELYPDFADELIEYFRDEVKIKGWGAPIKEKIKDSTSSNLIGDLFKVGNIILDGYEVIRQLGEGSYGSVHLLKHKNTGEKYAVKANKYPEHATEKFMKEIHIWVDLDHPNIVKCHFFSTMEDVVMVFSEFIEGCTLSEYIRQETYIEQEEQKQLEQVLDLAVQICFGIHAVHESKIIHQDIKPSNILVDKEGNCKLCDFGHGITIAYCSPELLDKHEQVKRVKLTPQSDVYSLGITIFEMFTGQLIWKKNNIPNGVYAGEALQRYWKQGACMSPFPRMPRTIFKILEKCLHTNPLKRWRSIQDIAHELIKLYKKIANKKYHRKIPIVKTLTFHYYVRKITSGAGWKSPDEWLESIGNVKISEQQKLNYRGSSRGHAIADIIGYEKAKERIEDLGKNFELQLANICIEKSLIHEYLNDHSGAIILQNKAISYYERASRESDLAQFLLPNAYMLAANTKRDLGDDQQAIALYDIAIRTLKLVSGGDTFQSLYLLSLIVMNKATMVNIVGLKEALRLYGCTLEILECIEPIIRQNDKIKPWYSTFLLHYGLNLANTGNILGDIGKKNEALEYYRKALKAYDRIDVDKNNLEVYSGIGRLYMNMGCTHTHQSCNSREAKEALKYYSKAEKIYEDLVLKHCGFLRDLALVNLNTGILFKKYYPPTKVEKLIGYFFTRRKALKCIDRAIKIYERLVIDENYSILRDFLSIAYKHKGDLLHDSGRTEEAIYYYQKRRYLV